MIVRIWHGRTKTNDAVAYREFVIETGIKEYLSTKGNLGAQIWQRQQDDITHIWTVSWWQDFESIKAFREMILKSQSIMMKTKNIYCTLNQQWHIMKHLITRRSLFTIHHINTNGCPLLFA